VADPPRNVSNAAGKETADAIRQEVAREVEQLLRIIFRDRKTGSPVDLEAIALKRDCFATIETSIRFVMHHAGAGALTQLQQFGEPDADHSTVPCSCGHLARYKELRSKTILSVLGPVQVRRPYYLCPDCSEGKHPADRKLGHAPPASFGGP
jgi:hypothetical protein